MLWAVTCVCIHKTISVKLNLDLYLLDFHQLVLSIYLLIHKFIFLLRGSDLIIYLFQYQVMQILLEYKLY